MFLGMQSGLQVSFAGVTAYLQELHILTILFRVFLATVCAGVLGLERQRKSRPAGLRTHIVVCIGATLVMMVNQSLVERGLSADAARLGAQVVSGIGFLGAGTIILTGRSGKPQVKGLTTAAGLWTSACMGLAIGCGFYVGAVITGLFVLFSVTVLNRIDVYLYSRSRALLLQLETESPSVVQSVCDLLEKQGVEIRDLRIANRKEEGGQTVSTVTLDLRMQNGRIKTNLLLGIAGIPGILAIEEI